MGSGGVGKSAITIQFINNQFQAKYDPTIEDRYIKVLDYKGVPCFIEVLDTAGQETFQAMRELYMKNGEGFALVFSITNQRSLSELEPIRNGILKAQNVPNIPLVLVGNKIDLENKRKVTKNEAEAVAKSWGVPLIEASAKENINIRDIFCSLIQQHWDNSGGPPIQKKKDGLCVIL